MYFLSIKKSLKSSITSNNGNWEITKALPMYRLFFFAFCVQDKQFCQLIQTNLIYYIICGYFYIFLYKGIWQSNCQTCQYFSKNPYSVASIRIKEIPLFKQSSIVLRSITSKTYVWVQQQCTKKLEEWTSWKLVVKLRVFFPHLKQQTFIIRNTNFALRPT